jgi:neutral ceramidase
LGGEVTYEVKQVVEAALAPRHVVFVGYTDDCAYIPGDRIIAEGGYEAEGSLVEYCLKGAIKAGVNGKVTKAFQEAAAELSRLRSEPTRSSSSPSSPSPTG